MSSFLRGCIWICMEYIKPGLLDGRDDQVSSVHVTISVTVTSILDALLPLPRKVRFHSY